MVTRALAALILGVFCMCGVVLMLAVSDFRARQERLRRSRARVAETIAATTCDTDAEILAVAEQALEERPELRDDDISVLRMLIALDRALDHALEGRDITEDAPKEWVP